MQWLLWRCRGREMKAFAKRIETLPPPQAYAVGGDFNTLAFHPIIGRLRRSLDLRTGSLKQPTWRHLAQPNSILKTNIDYVGSLRSGDLRLTNLTVLERQPSDHAPMLATFELEGGRG